MGGVMLSRRAGPGAGKYNAESPKQGSKRFKLYYSTMTIRFARLGIIFIYARNLPKGPISGLIHAQCRGVMALFSWLAFFFTEASLTYHNNLLV